MVNNFKTRALSSLFLLSLLVTLYLLKLNHFIFLIFFILVYLELFNNSIINIKWILILFVGYCFFLYFNEFIYNILLSQKFIFLLFFFSITCISFLKKKIFYSKVILNIFIYLCFVLFTLLYVYNFNLFFIVILLTSTNDILAYISGSYFKGPKIIPFISPNKTWSGSLISYLVSILLLFYLFDFHYAYNLLLPIMFFIGDIYFSYFKRILAIKDYGQLIKGHGGFLDRFDSSFLSLSFSFIFFSFV